MRARLGKVKEWYQVNERRVSTASLVTGFVLDSLTLQRIDALRENLWIVLNMLLVGTCIVLLNRQENEGVDTRDESKKHFWLFNLLQFGFGALLGTFFVFYFRSATLAAAWPFLLMLLVAMVANELFQKRYARLTFQISFYYLALLLFAIFLVPVALKRIGPEIFLLSGVVSLLALWLLLSLLSRFARENFRKNRSALMRSVAGIFLVINILYFTNIIPPIPLSLKDAGVYHSVTRTVDGEYLLEGEDKSLRDYFRLHPIVHLMAGESLYVFSAVFSPTDLDVQIVHEWQYQDAEGEWQTSSRISLSVSGGRDEGFRTFSAKTSLTPGLWRVNVATVRGQLIGRATFEVAYVPSQPSLITFIK